MNKLIIAASLLVTTSANAQMRVELKPKEVCWTAGWIDFTPKTINYQDSTLDVEYNLFSDDTVCIESRVIKLPLAYIGLFSPDADRAIISQLLWEHGNLEIKEND